MSARYRVGAYIFEPASGELTDPNGVVRSLQPQLGTLLQVLIEHAGQVVSRDVLYEALWPNTKVEFDLGLNAAVRSLRAALEDDAQAPRYVKTLRRRGYRLIAPVESLPVDLSDLEQHRALGRPIRLGQRRIRTTIGVAAGLLGATLLIHLIPETGVVAPVDEVPQLAEARYLVGVRDSASVSRGLAILASLSPDIRGSAEALAIEAEAAYLRGALAEAGALARRAIAIKPDHASALRVLGNTVLYYEHNPKQAEPILRRASEVESNAANLHAHALALATVGDYRGAMARVRRAMEIDPVAVNITFDGWFIAYIARDFTTSLEACDAFSRLVDRPPWRCQLYSELAIGRRAEAAALARAILEAADSQGVLPETPTDSETTLRSFWRWELARPRPGVPPGSLAFAQARALALLGRRDEAIAKLDRARALGASEIVFAPHLPYFDGLRQHPGYEAFLARVAAH